MLNPILPWQQQNWVVLNRYLQQQRIPQALLISGAKGLGKYQLALQLSQTLLCSNRLETGLSCQTCTSCTLFKAGTHPDFMQISPEEDKKIIGIDAIRGLITKLTLKPQFDSYRVVLIQPADQLNNAAANSFLKCLEEPNERTCIVLLSEKPQQLPATIRSRCQKLLVATPSLAVAREWLKSQGITEHLDVLLSLAQGAPLLAQQYVSETLIATRLQCFDDWLKVGAGQLNPISLAEQWYKQDVKLVLFWQISWITDMIKCCYSADSASLYHVDLKQPLQQRAKQLNLQQMYRFYDSLLERMQKLDTQINKQLLLEELLIAWLNLNKRS